MQTRYEAWRQTSNGQMIYAAVARAAMRLRRRGIKRYGVAALFEAARYTHALRAGVDADGFKCNNNWRSRLVRELIVEYPELAGMFELRELKS